ncbi:MAG: hypothetical protein Q9M15_02630 [Mariprofundaceae bacterium]|nr:hypothetical protein [Mariprofundaceae bacterium]
METADTLRHFTLLRKVITQTGSGTIFFQAPKVQSGTVNIQDGKILNDDATLTALKKLLHCKKMIVCNLIASSKSSLNLPRCSETMLCQALNHVTFDHEILMRLKKSFLKLPPIKVNMNPLHRYGYKDGLTYMMLYQESLKKECFTVSDFFSMRPAYVSLEQQIKVLILGYCLGLINPRRKERKNHPHRQVSHRMNIVHRIFNRIKNID